MNATVSPRFTPRHLPYDSSLTKNQPLDEGWAKCPAISISHHSDNTPSLKLILKIDGWKTFFRFLLGFTCLLAGAMSFSFREVFGSPWFLLF